MFTSFLKKLFRGYPILPYVAFGLILAWVFILNSGTGWLSDVEINGENMTVLFVSSTLVAGVLMVAVSRFSERAQARCLRPSFVLMAAGVSSLSCFVIVVIGPYYLMRYLPLPVTMALFYLGSACSGIGLAAVLLRCAMLFGELSPRRAILYVAFSHIVASLVYFVLIGSPSWAPVHGGPSLIGIMTFVGLPLVAAFFCSFGDLVQDEERKAEGGGGAGAGAGVGGAAAGAGVDEGRTTHWKYSGVSGVGAFRKLVAVVFVFGFVIAVIRSVSVQSLMPFETFEGTRLIMLLRIVMATVIACFAVGFDAERFKFARPYTVIMVAAVMVITVLPVLGVLHTFSGQIVVLVSFLFDFMMWCILSFIVHQKHLPAQGVFGLCYGLYLVGMALGWVFGSSVLVDLIGSTAEYAVYAVLAFAVLASAFFLFSEKELDIIFAPKNEREETLTQMLAEDLTIKNDAAKAKPARFTGAIDCLADEYGLTAREKDIFRELAMGHDASSISKSLHISWNTVRTHTRNAYAKMGIHSKQELIELVDDAKRKAQ